MISKVRNGFMPNQQIKAETVHSDTSYAPPRIANNRQRLASYRFRSAWARRIGIITLDHDGHLARANQGPASIDWRKVASTNRHDGAEQHRLAPIR
jgi:hypothetical protein